MTNTGLNVAVTVSIDSGMRTKASTVNGADLQRSAHRQVIAVISGRGTL